MAHNRRSIVEKHLILGGRMCITLTMYEQVNSGVQKVAPQDGRRRVVNASDVV